MFHEIEDYYQVSDGNDWHPAVMRAQHAFRASNLPNDFRGFTLTFRAREYRFSASIELIRGMSIAGSGGAMSGTKFLFPQGVDGIVCHRKETAPAATPGAGDWSIVERVLIQADGDLSQNSADLSGARHMRAWPHKTSAGFCDN